LDNQTLPPVCELRRGFKLTSHTGGSAGSEVVLEIVVRTNVLDTRLRREMRNYWRDVAVRWEAEVSGRIPDILELANAVLKNVRPFKAPGSCVRMDPAVRIASFQLWLAQARLVLFFLRSHGLSAETRDDMKEVVEQIRDRAREFRLNGLKGLSDGYQTDWDTLVLESTKSLVKAQENVRTRQNGGTKTSDSDPPASGHAQTLQSLPRLLLLQQEKRSVMIVGGDQRPEKLRSIQALTGLILDWRGASHKMRRGQSVIKFIHNQRLAGVVILEGLIGHSHAGSQAIVAECRKSEIPFAMAGTGGIESLMQALKQIEAARSASQ